MMMTCQPATVMSHGCTSTTRSVAAAIPELRFAAGRPLMNEVFTVCLHRLDMMPQAACWMTVTSEMADSRPTEHALESHGAVLHFLGLGSC